MSKSQTEYDREAARIGALPRAERFEELMEFPQRHALKAIGGGEIEAAVRAALEAIDHTPAEISRRMSSGGKYTSLTVHVDVADGVALDRVYAAVEGLDSVRYLL